MMRRFKIPFLVAALLALTAAVVLTRRALRDGGSGAAAAARPAEALPEMKTAKAKVEPMVRTIELPGTVEPVRVARLASPAEGPVEDLSIREGDRVGAHQRLLRIGRGRGARARLASDREELRKARDELDRVHRLVDARAVPGEWLDKARADHERARAQAEAGEESAGDYDVRAPWSGLVSRVLVSDGNYVAPRTVLVEMFDPHTLVVRIALPEAFALGLSEKAAAHVTLDAVPGRQFKGELARLYPDLDRKLRTRVAELVLQGAPPLVPGAFARVQLAVESIPDALVVPASAVISLDEGARAVFVVDSGRAVRRRIETGLDDGRRVQLRSGVRPGEEVVVAGQAKLEDGRPVRVKPPDVAAGVREVAVPPQKQIAESRAP
jgi:membrane fusion protein (multidrug efflux system)